MYGKVFTQMYDSSVCDCWEALVTFQQFIVLSDSQGVVDMTPEALSRRTSIPIEIIKKGIAELEKPDDRSRSPKAGGRRIERLDAHRTWGWQIVNHAYYRQLASMEDKREADRVRIATKREAERSGNTGLSRDVADSSGQSKQVANVAYTDTDANTDTERHKDMVSCADRWPEFWKAYPKKVKRKGALKIWKARKLDAMADIILADIKTRLTEDARWRKDGGQYIPDPTTYLNQDRWDDEITAPQQRKRA